VTPLLATVAARIASQLWGGVWTVEKPPAARTP
jgi:hypothetical protein